MKKCITYDVEGVKHRDGPKISRKEVVAEDLKLNLNFMDEQH